MSFQGKVAIVTGGAQGIGKGFSLALLGIGMKVCIVDINEITASQLIASLSEEFKANVIFHNCDVTSFDEFEGAFEKTIKVFGRIDVVVNNAGIFDEINWRKTIDVNFIGTINGLKLAFKYMGIDNGGSGGYIVNTTSKAVYMSTPLCPVYTATKYGITGLAKSYGTDYHLEKSAIKVCAIAPGSVDTPMYKHFEDKSLDAELFRKAKVDFEVASPEDLGNGLLKLLQDGRNGAEMRVEGSKIFYV